MGQTTVNSQHQHSAKIQASKIHSGLNRACGERVAQCVHAKLLDTLLPQDSVHGVKTKAVLL
jgi:hypothetical protein